MIAETAWDLEDFRKRIREMPDEKLIRYGKAARYMADPRNAADKRTVRDVHLIQLRECRAEYRRRHPNESHANTSGQPNENAAANRPLQDSTALAD